MRTRRSAKVMSSRSCAWSAAGELGTLLPYRRLGLGALVPRLGACGHLHSAFVALAGQQHRVARPRDLDRTLDRGAPVEHDLVVPAGRLADDPRLHIPCDLRGVFPE